MSLELLAIPAGMVLRSVGGWVENSFEDGEDLAMACALTC